MGASLSGTPDKIPTLASLRQISFHLPPSLLTTLSWRFHPLTKEGRSWSALCRMKSVCVPPEATSLLRGVVNDRQSSCPVQKLRRQVAEYLKAIDPENVTTGLWKPEVQWNRWHGDGKSSTHGVFHIETMRAKNGDYQAKVIGASGHDVLFVVWSNAETSSPPTEPEVVDALKAELAKA